MNEQPNPAQMQAFAERAGDGPVVMLNLIRFKADGGQESYLRYTQAVAPLLAEVSGEVVYMGRGAELVIGTEDNSWDLVLLVRYPTRGHMLRMAGSEAYAKIKHLRDESLSRSVLLATDPAGGAPTS